MTPGFRIPEEYESRLDTLLKEDGWQNEECAFPLSIEMHNVKKELIQKLMSSKL